MASSLSPVAFASLAACFVRGAVDFAAGCEGPTVPVTGRLALGAAVAFAVLQLEQNGHALHLQKTQCELRCASLQNEEQASYRKSPALTERHDTRAELDMQSRYELLEFEVTFP
eukprot:1615625-Prymnesium_polylepis.1